MAAETGLAGRATPSPRPRAAQPRRDAEPTPSTTSRVEYASRLPGGFVVVTGWYRATQARTRRFRTAGARTGSITFTRHADAGRDASDRANGFLAVVHDWHDGRVEVELGGAAVELDFDGAERVDLQTLAWLGMAGVDGDTRTAATSLLASMQPVDAGRSVALEFSACLLAFRDALRERLPECDIDPRHPLGLSIELLHRVDARSFYVRGWMRDAAGEITTLTALSPEGTAVDLTTTVVPLPRPDVEQFYGAGPEQQATARSGFLAYFELPDQSHLERGWIFRLGNRAGSSVEAAAPEVIDSPATLLATVLHDLAHDRPGADAVLRDHAFPALAKVQAQRAAGAAIESVTQYGAPPDDPVVTVIVPLYQRIDFVEHQLAHFVDDPDMARVDLIYVLDSPELSTALAGAAAPLHRLYGVPFRTAVMKANAGYALANNAGASIARGRLLVLLNSDVVPDCPGWLRRMASFYDKTPHAGVVGPKLIYEDQAIQHAGMYFIRPHGSPWWENAHFFKGLHRTFGPANVARTVPAVTGACLMISTELWHEVGGLSGAYVQGDYEDSDLCLRLAEVGYDAWYLPRVELYHLEGQSYPTHLRRQTSRFNTWLHTHLWGERIEAVMARIDQIETTSHPSGNGET